MERKQAIDKLKNLVDAQDTYLAVGSWKLEFLPNFTTKDYCQIIEASDLDGKEVSFPQHEHLESQEVFYQVKGETKFWDGTILHAGELKIIPPKMLHSATICQDGMCVIIVHPVEIIYKEKNNG